MSNFSTLIYEKHEGNIARIWLNRPETRNAQDTRMIDELSAAYDMAVADQEIHVIVLAAKGPHFSSGHDLSEFVREDVPTLMDSRDQRGTWSDKDWNGASAYYAREKEIYEQYCCRWRDLSKPTIASVHGKVIAGGLMLVWPCDFVIASEDATFQDNTIDMGIPGVEYFAYTWELGIRKAKEFLIAGLPLSAEEAKVAGMVNQVVARDDLEAATLALAQRIASKPTFGVKLAKDAINATYSAQGFENVQRNAFNAHHLAHTHYRFSQNGSLIDKGFLKKGRSSEKWSTVPGKKSSSE